MVKHQSNCLQACMLGVQATWLPRGPQTALKQAADLVRAVPNRTLLHSMVSVQAAVVAALPAQSAVLGSGAERGRHAARP